MEFPLFKNYINSTHANLLLEKLGFPICNNNIERNSIKRYGPSGLHESSIYDPVFPDYIEDFRLFFDFHTVTINWYCPGQVIKPHVDTLKADNEIKIISLLSDEYLHFREDRNKTNKFSLLLPKNSLFIMKDNLRYKYEHSLVASEKRISIVFRSYSKFVK